MAPKDGAIVSKAKSETPYQLDRSEVHKASHALITHIRQGGGKESATSKDLFKAAATSPDEEPEPIWLVLTTKKHIIDKKRLKPGKISIPHALVKSDTSICLITADPQRAYKDAIADPLFPEDLRARIRVLGIAKIRQRYKSFESRRQLLAEYDVFLADDRVVTLLPNLLGKTVYESSKRPIPVDLQGSSKGVRIAKPQAISKEIEKALQSARIHLSPSVTTAVLVGYSSFEADKLQQNIEAVVEGMQSRFVPQGWRNIRAIHIKGPNTVALPVWLASQLWVDQDDVLEDKKAEEASKLASQKGRKRKHKGGEAIVGGLKKKTKLIGTEEGFSEEMAQRRAALRQQKKQAREELEGGDGGIKT